MKGLFEAVLNLEVANGTEKACKKAFEQKNERYLTKYTSRDGNGNIIKDEFKSVWGGNHCHVDVLYSSPGKKGKLTVSTVSRTLQNVRDAVTDYQILGAGLIHKNWR